MLATFMNAIRGARVLLPRAFRVYSAPNVTEFYLSNAEFVSRLRACIHLQREREREREGMREGKRETQESARGKEGRVH